MAARAYVFDLDGTLYQDGAALPGAIDTVAALRAQGVPLRFLTNTTSRCRRLVVERLTGYGFDVRAGEVFTPPSIAGAFLRAHGASAHCLVTPATREDFAGVPTADHPDHVVVGDLGDGWTAGILTRAFRLLMDGAGLIALGRTRYWRREGELHLDVGPWVAALEYAAQTEALVFGKPEPAFFRAVVDDLGLPSGQVTLVGDDLVTDVRAAQSAGLRGVLVRTGKFRAEDLDAPGPAPDAVVDSVAALLP